MTENSKCPWHVYLRVDKEGKFYITTNGEDTFYGDKEKLRESWEKKCIPNTKITYSVIDETGKIKKK